MSIGSHHRVSRSDGLITLQANARQIKGFEEFAELTPKAVAVAQRRAINKTLRWLRTHVARSVGQQQRIAIASVRQRLKAYPIKGEGPGKLWFGINPLEASRAGRVRQTRAGVSVAGRSFQGAFFKRVYGDRPDIWIRAGSKYFTDEAYPLSTVTANKRGRSGWIAESTSLGRFPLGKAKISLEDVRPHFNAWTQKAHERLLVVMKQELNFELQKLLGRIANG